MEERNSTTQPVHRVSPGKRMLIGAAIGLVLILFFILPVGKPNPEWGKLWMIKPLIVTPLAGLIAGVSYHLMDHLRYQGGWKKILANIFGVIIYIFILWIGTVLGLNGTLWN